MSVSVMIKEGETMRASSVHVVMRHAIADVQCVNVVIGVHIVVLCVLLVVIRYCNFAVFSWHFRCSIFSEGLIHDVEAPFLGLANVAVSN